MTRNQWPPVTECMGLDWKDDPSCGGGLSKKKKKISGAPKWWAGKNWKGVGALTECKPHENIQNPAWSHIQSYAIKWKASTHNMFLIKRVCLFCPAGGEPVRLLLLHFSWVPGPEGGVPRDVGGDHQWPDTKGGVRPHPHNLLPQEVTHLTVGTEAA